MSRFLLIAVFLLGTVAIFVAAVSFLAYGYSPKREGELSVTNLEATTQIGWDDHGIPWIYAESDTDAAVSLGYAHAVDHTESIVLLRQAALGKLNAWEGASAVPLDLFARRLGFERLAREAYQNLGNEDRRRLEAYVAGVNRALDTPGVHQKEAFVRQRIESEQWEPWHPIAVERLLAYLATPRLQLDSTYQALAHRDSIVAQFAETDSLFRATLGLWGWRHGRAYGTNGGIVFHQPLGDSALPVLAGSILRIEDETTVLGTIPGTLMTPFGSSGSRSWAIVLSGQASLESAGESMPRPTFERLVAANGNETLIRLIRDENGLVLNPRSRWRLSWDGFESFTDIEPWRMIVTPGAPLPSFSLIHGAGVIRDNNQLQTIGEPLVQTQSEGHGFVSEHPAAASAARRLEAIANAPIRELARDTESPWAADRLPALLEALPDRNSLDQALVDPYTFLRSWNHRFSTNAIAPTLFEHWLQGIDEVIGFSSPDSVATDWRLPLTLRLGTAMVRDAQGDAESKWRWQQTFPNRLRPPFGNTDWTCRPFSIPEGHPTTLLPGPSRHIEHPPGPAMWSSWISFDSAQDGSFASTSWSIRRPVCAPETPTETPVQTIDLDSPPTHSIRLVPSRR